MVLTLLKARIAATMSGFGSGMRKNSARKRGVGFKIFIGILMVYIILCAFFLFGMIFWSIAPAFHALGFDWLYYSVAGILAFALCFIGSIFMAQHQIFEAKDNELRGSMPIKPSAPVTSTVSAMRASFLCAHAARPCAAAVGSQYRGGFAFIIAYPTRGCKRYCHCFLKIFLKKSDKRLAICVGKAYAYSRKGFFEK